MPRLALLSLRAFGCILSKNTPTVSALPRSQYRRYFFAPPTPLPPTPVLSYWPPCVRTTQQHLIRSGGGSQRSRQQCLRRARCLWEWRGGGGSKSVYRRLEWARVHVGRGLPGARQHRGGRRRRRFLHSGTRLVVSRRRKGVRLDGRSRTSHIGVLPSEAPWLPSPEIILQGFPSPAFSLLFSVYCCRHQRARIPFPF